MEYWVEIILIVLQFPVFLGLIYWFVRLQNETRRRGRIRISFRDLSRRTKLFGILLRSDMVFTLYLAIASVLNLTGTVPLPLSGLNSVVTLRTLAIGLVGLAYLMSVNSSRSSNLHQSDGKQ